MKMEWTLKTDEELRESLRICQFDEGELERQAAFHKGLADPTRLKIVRLLGIAPMCLCELSSALEVPNSTLTHHLRLLERGEVIRSTRLGRNTVFQLTEKEVGEHV
ncbi:ArsR family transcriptional regulator [Exiguobacterium sp. SH1S4]|nr:transcriptional regulator [Exiguobacterium sp. SH31]TCI47676.1 ArsR family transcriptional regulator [Exiguobacterium sp. SH5S32]TCI54561.1 ArsR family transcriptional regulator [Exiguobacterium sp. SH1S4]TCI56407.1 ArsR family transcriptional regulator [Exiguobacterium sp. SH1S21]TCI61411.1 ArsR family transcriptional regulator [Exiguobacterium sp. SH0S2]TCI74356.1 ArsR family transcriptional regulator [Exiguobacterium sp. SH1S1]